MDLQKDAEIMDMSLIIKQVCQQLGLMEVMQRGSGPERVITQGLRVEVGPQGKRWSWTPGLWPLQLWICNSAAKAIVYRSF